MYGPILFVLGTKTTPDGIHTHTILFCNPIKDGRLASILVVKKTKQKNNTRCRTCPQPFLEYAFTDVIQTWHTDKE